MSQRESRLSRQIMDALRQEGHFCFKVHGNATMMAGLPDVVVCAQGLFVGLEVKLPENRNGATKIQRHRANEIWRAGGECLVVCSVREAKQVVANVVAARSHRIVD